MLKSREVILFGIETTTGQDPGLSATDAILVENLSWANEDPAMIERRPVKSTFGGKKAIFAGSLKSVSFDVEIKGSGTAGTAPEIGTILRAAGHDETIVAVTSVTYAPVSSSLETGTLYYYEDGMLRKLHGCVVSSLEMSLTAKEKPMMSVTIVGHQMSWGTAQAGAATSITLAATSSAVDDTYNGQTIRIIAGTGSGQSKTITDYVGATKVATVSAWTTTPDATSVYEISGGPIDTAIITPSYDSTVPAPIIAVPFSIGSYEACISSLTLSPNLEISKPPCIRSPDGVGTIRIVDRDVTGTIDPEATLVATNDWEGDWKDGTELAISCGPIGSTAGNIIEISIPAAYYREIAPGEREKLKTYDIGFGAIETSGDDQYSIVFT